MSTVIIQTMCSLVQTYSINKGIKQFGDQAVKSLEKEMGQMNMRGAFEPIKYENWEDKNKKKIIESLIFITEKQDGTIKSRFCADGRKQQDWLSKEDTSSPTASLELLMILAAIDAKEQRNVITIDIPNAFIQTEQDANQTIFMRIKEKLCKMMVHMIPEIYKDFITYKKETMTLYVKLNKTMYGTLTASLLYYQKWVSNVTEEGFILNCYDTCVANKLINDKQQTLRWNVDNVMVSHEDLQVTEILWNGPSPNMKTTSALSRLLMETYTNI